MSDKIIRFVDEQLRGYGFDLEQSRVIFFTETPVPFERYLDHADQYRLNNRVYSHSMLHMIAARDMYDFRAAAKGAGFSDTESKATPEMSKVLHNNQNSCGQHAFTDEALNGFGFDLILDRVIMFMGLPRPHYLTRADQYLLNNHTYTHSILRMIAVRCLVDQFEASGDNGGVTQDLCKIAPSFPYVLYSEKNQCSQYFFANTTIGQALALMGKRGENIAVDDIRILNIDTRVVNKVSAKRSFEYTLEPL